MLGRLIRSRGVIITIIGAASVGGAVVVLIHGRLRSAATLHIGIGGVAVHAGGIFWGDVRTSVHVAVVVVIRGGSTPLRS